MTNVIKLGQLLNTEEWRLRRLQIQYKEDILLEAYACEREIKDLEKDKKLTNFVRLSALVDCLEEAARHYELAGQLKDSNRCRQQALAYTILLDK